MFNKFNFSIKDFASKSDLKLELGGIYFNQKECVATDSFTLIRVQLPEFNHKDYPDLQEKVKPLKKFKPFILPIKEADKILKLIPKSPTLPILENAVLIKQEKNTVEFATTDLDSIDKIKARTIIGDFPNYKELLTKKGRYVKTRVSAKFLKRIASFLDSFDNATSTIDIEIPIKDGEPLRFYGKRGEQKCEIMLMPVSPE